MATSNSLHGEVHCLCRSLVALLESDGCATHDSTPSVRFFVAALTTANPGICESDAASFRAISPDAKRKTLLLGGE